MKRRTMIKVAGAAAFSSLLPDIRSGIYGSDISLMPQGELMRFGDGRDWFFSRRFGMFIHWGIYAIPGWHEQHQWRMRVPRASYMELARQWNPVKFSPDKWLDLMEEGGMSYLTITAKHHDGFCLWDTKQTSFNTMNTPYGRDIIGMIADACHRRKVPLCIYYSIADWNHPNYPNQGRHHELPGPEPGDRPDWEAYMEFLKAQVRELCTGYGEIHGFWWDMNVPQHRDPSINEMIRKLQPKAVINNRGFDEGDFGTPEREYDKQAAEASFFHKPVEACNSAGMESWGYRREEDYYTKKHLERSIDSYLSRGANYLLNVGPDASGIIPPVPASIVKNIGKWYKKVKESYEEVKPAPFKLADPSVMLTTRDRTLYLHVNRDLPGNRIKLKPINVMPIKATLLNTGEKVDCVVNYAPGDYADFKEYLRIRNLPVEKMCNTVMVIKLEFDRDIEAIAG